MQMRLRLRGILLQHRSIRREERDERRRRQQHQVQVHAGTRGQLPAPIAGRFRAACTATTLAAAAAVAAAGKGNSCHEFPQKKSSAAAAVAATSMSRDAGTCRSHGRRASEVGQRTHTPAAVHECLMKAQTVQQQCSLSCLS